jgi:NAD-dependent deacetylase
MASLTITESSRVLVLTGAGVSAESGVPTFRSGGGLWESHPVEEVASMPGFQADPQLVWRFYSERRRGVLGVEPNPGHFALATLEQAIGDRMLLSTQNVDGLHRRAGSERVVEMHGNLLQSRCVACSRPPFSDQEQYHDRLPTCDECEARGNTEFLRPHIVWFGEALDYSVLQRIQDFISDAGEELIFIAIGTSGHVYPAASMVDAAKAVGGETWLVNLDDADNASRFDHVIRGKSGEVLPDLLAL